MTTLSLVILIVFLLVVNLTGRWTGIENEFYSFPSKELSAYLSFWKIENNPISQFTSAFLRTTTPKLFLKNLIVNTVSNKKYTTYHNNYFVAFKNIKLLL